MPNWCENRVSIYGDENEINAFKKKALKDGEFKFNNLLPMPKELQDTTSGWLGNDTPEQKELEKKQAKNLKKYGYQNWYDWACDVWGTKWDVDASVDVGDDYIEISFDTAWCPPEGVFNYIKKQYPDLSVSWFYDEPGMEIAGYLEQEDIMVYVIGRPINGISINGLEYLLDENDKIIKFNDRDDCLKYITEKVTDSDPEDFLWEKEESEVV